MNIKWVTPEEYVRLKREAELYMPYGSYMYEMPNKELLIWYSDGRQQVLVKVADTPLLRELI